MKEDIISGRSMLMREMEIMLRLEPQNFLEKRQILLDGLERQEKRNIGNAINALMRRIIRRCQEPCTKLYSVSGS